jgi:hypothetical protein
MKTCWFALVFATHVALAAEPTLGSNPARFPAGTGVFSEASAFAGNDFVPISKLLKDDWGPNYSPRPGQNLAVLGVRWETGFNVRGYRIGYVYRQEWFGRADKDSLDLAHADRQDRDFDAGRTYKLDYTMKGFAADGIRVGKAFSTPLPRGWVLDWGLAASGLRGNRMRTEFLTGSATGKGGQDVDAEGSWERNDSNTNTVARGFAPAFVEGEARGEGYSGDFGLVLKSPGGLTLEWSVMDAVGRMYWYAIPQITLSGSTTFSGTLPSGRAVRVDLIEDLSAKHSVAFSMPVSGLRLEVADHFFGSYHFPRVGIRTEARPLQLRVDYDIYFHAVGLGLAYRWFQVGFTTDDLHLATAKTVAFDVSLRFQF